MMANNSIAPPVRCDDEMDELVAADASSSQEVDEGDAEIAAIDKLVAEGAASVVTNGGPMGKCAMCASPPAEGMKLRACSQCKLAWYCSKECQGADWKRGHKKACKTLQTQTTMAGNGGMKHETRPWLQNIDDAALNWPPKAIFESASAAAKLCLARTPELRGPRSHMMMMINPGNLPPQKAEDEKSPMVLLNQTVGPTLLKQIQKLGSASAAAAQPQHLQMAGALSNGLVTFIRMFDAQCTARTKTRLKVRGVKLKGKQKAGVFGFVVVECGVAIEDVLAPRGSRALVPVAVIYLDAPSIEYYIRQRYDENHGARDPDNARMAAEHMIKQLNDHIAKNGAAHLVWLTFYKHKEPPYFFGGSLMAQGASDAKTKEAFSALMGMVLADTTPNSMKMAQACEVTLNLNEEVPFIIRAKFFGKKRRMSPAQEPIHSPKSSVRSKPDALVSRFALRSHRLRPGELPCCYHR